MCLLTIVLINSSSNLALGLNLNFNSLFSNLISKSPKFKLIFAIVALAGAIVLIIGFTTNGGIYKAIGKQLLKRAMFGFYMVVVGIVAGICGAVTGK